MKKIINFLVIIFLFSYCLSVNALSFSDKENNYVLEKIDIPCLDGYDFYDYDQDNNMIFAKYDLENTYIKLDSNYNCHDMTSKEVLDFLNQGIVHEFMRGEENIPEGSSSKYNIVVEKNSYSPEGYIKTKDTKINEEKQYFVIEDNGDVVYSVGAADINKINEYYENVYFKKPLKAEIDVETTYYVRRNSFIFEEVLNPVVEDIEKYYVLINERLEDEVISYIELNEEIVDKLYEEYGVVEIIKDEYSNNYYFMACEDYSYEIFDIYDINGNKIEALKEINGILFSKNGLISIRKNDKHMFYNQEFELVHEFVDINNLFEIYNSEDRGLFFEYDIENEKLNYYELKTYKVLEGNNLTYKGSDLTIRFSGNLDNLEKVLVNDKELDKNNYTLLKGSVIVTLKNDYLKTLTTGEYTLKLVYNDGGFASTNFNIDINNPPTYDSNQIFIVCFVSLIALIFSVCYYKKIKN